MYNHVVISGFGVIGTEVLDQLIKINKKNQLKVSIIEKKFSNFPGGIAYSKNNSMYGFFNNPLRLSSIDFQKWMKIQKNQKNLINIFKIRKELKLDKWLKNNIHQDKKKFKNINQIYLPRIAYSIFLKEKFLKMIRTLKNKSFVKIDYYENELLKIKKIKNRYICYTKGKLTNKKFVEKNFTFIKSTKKQTKKNYLESNKIVLGHGILPPSNINLKHYFYNKNYIHDFYTSGGTNNLINKINKINNENQTQKKIVIAFIGNKAGLLETMQQFENLDQKLLNKVSIVSISSSSLTLQKAQLSKKYKSYKFALLIPKNIKKIKKAKKILTFIKSEFSNGKKNGYNKYDIWTLILQKKIIDKCFKRLNSKEKSIYNNEVFSQLRNITRYTYPETVDAKIRLEKNEVLKTIKDKVVELKNSKKKIIVKTSESGFFRADLVVNVSGPVSLFKNNKEVAYLNSLKKICKNYNERGFISDEFNQIEESLYAPGTLSSNFNPERKTIIGSIIENCKLTAKHIQKFR
jgi:uncharacterized NAD(P)/FAD-binding protein YdhS